MDEQRKNISRKAAFRFGDCSDGTIFVTWADDEIRMMTIPKFETITFTTSGCQSVNTMKALFNLFNAMRKDNIDTPQEKCKNEDYIQQRFADDLKGELTVCRERDMKISIMPRDHENFIPFNTWNTTRSPHTRDALIDLFEAMEKDDIEKPQ